MALILAHYSNTSENIDVQILDTLFKKGLIDQRQQEQITKTAGELNASIASTISRLGIVADDSLYHVISELLNWTLISKVSQCPSPQLILQSTTKLKLNVDWCIENNCFFTSTEELGLAVYVPSLDKLSAVKSIMSAVNQKPASWLLMTPAMSATIEDDIVRERAVSELFGTSSTDLSALAEEAPVINLVNSIVERAIHAEASDIHIEAGEKNMVVRFRVDGKLNEFMQQPASRFPAIASRIKLLSQLDISERRLPQDGRFSTRAGKNDFDVRVSTAPDVHGESIVMRLLPKNREELSLGSLGIEDDHLALFKEWGSLSNGIVLVTGPTGSGKSTTLYALLSDIKTGEEKIVTVEDPVEYQLPGITQVQARADIGYTFARALRTFLRQDPDIIMVGEIRDKETADIAVQSSLTGHLVLSTLHTNDACSVFPRLSDIGVEHYLTAATVQGVQAQRLVRKLCDNCCEDATPPEFLASHEAFRNVLNFTQSPMWKKPVGCSACHGKGFKGRMGIYELIPVTPELRNLIAENANVTSIRLQARKQGFRSLLEDGLRKAAKGLTSVEEVLRVCTLEEE